MNARALTLLALSLTAAYAQAQTTPIQHLIVVVGENRTFDSLFATYQAPAGQTVKNLLSQGIVNADGTPGPNFGLAAQRQGVVGSTYTIQPSRGAPYATLPQPLLTGVLNPDLSIDNGTPDTRYPNNLPNGPYQLTKGTGLAWSSTMPATGDPVHRFFQMWQQTGGDNAQHDMFVWVADTVGKGPDNGPSGPSATNAEQGGELMGFYNMAQGDSPLFKSLAQQYAISDNYHQAVMGGTGANFFALATAGDLPVFNTDGTLATPWDNQIENPDPQPGTANFYKKDGYQGGSYVNCADPSQPGVAAIASYLAAKGRATNCAPGAYYLVNNYNPPFDINGKAQKVTQTSYVYPPQRVPTIAEKMSAGNVSWKWYTGARDWADVIKDPNFPTLYAEAKAEVAATLPPGTPQALIDAIALQQLRTKGFYNNIGDPLVASVNITGTPLAANLQGLTSFYNDVKSGALPAVSFVVPKNLDSGHPGYSTAPAYESFVNDLIAKVQANKALWAHTAILITTDEGGGAFDTGYIQNLDFFGDGPRIPLIVVSPYAKRGVVDHVYNDHASISKFIERNWSLSPLSARSRDNLPNPIPDAANPYKPVNEPAIGDLMSLFQF
jgi:phospholipase C